MRQNVYFFCDNFLIFKREIIRPLINICFTYVILKYGKVVNYFFSLLFNSYRNLQLILSSRNYLGNLELKNMKRCPLVILPYLIRHTRYCKCDYGEGFVIIFSSVDVYKKKFFCCIKLHVFLSQVIDLAYKINYGI